MPIYVYQVIEEDGSEGDSFEVVQSFHDAPLTVHPESGKPVQRVIGAPRVGGRWSDMGNKAALSDKKLDAAGFTKYVKMGDGVYEKRTGKGPDVISADG